MDRKARAAARQTKAITPTEMPATWPELRELLAEELQAEAPDSVEPESQASRLEPPGQARSTGHSVQESAEIDPAVEPNVPAAHETVAAPPMQY
jgi:hypothetical protein